MKVTDNVLELIGSTPMVKLNKTNKGVKATVLTKLLPTESYNTT